MGLPVEAVCEAFDLGRPQGRPLRATGGLLHQVWRLDTDSGSFAVKVLRPPAGVEEAAWLLDYQRSFELEKAALEAGLPAPRPMTAQNGGWLAGVAGRSVRVHAWIDGRRPPDRELEPGLAGRAGALLARIHALRVVRETAPESVLPTWPPEAWRQRETQLPELRGMAAVQADLNRVMEEARTLVRDPVLSHRDVNPKNLILEPGGSLTLIDWELNGPVEPALEAAGSALDWGGAFWWEPDPAVVRAFLAGYRAGGGCFPAQPDERILAAWLGDAAGFAVTCYRRALRASTATERQRGRSNAAFMVRQLRRGLDARSRWLPLLQA